MPSSLQSHPTMPSIRRDSSIRRESTTYQPLESELFRSYDYPIDSETNKIEKHVGIGSGKRIFIGIGGGALSTKETKGKSRAGSSASASEFEVKESDGKSEIGSYEEESVFRSKRLHRALRNISYAEDISPSKNLKSWHGGSFEIGGDIREAHRRAEDSKLRAVEAKAAGTTNTILTPSIFDNPTTTQNKRARADTVGSSFRTAIFSTRPRSDTLATFKSAVSHQDSSSPSPAPSIIFKENDSRSASAVSLASPSVNSVKPAFLPIPRFRASVRSASESYPGVRSNSSPSKSILRSSSLSYPNNTRPFQPFQPQPSKLSTGILGANPSASNHSREGKDSSVLNLAIPEAEEEMVTTPEEMESREKVEQPSDILRAERMLIRIEWTAREDLPDSFDVNSSRKHSVERRASWEEALVHYKEDRLEIYTDSTFLGSKKLRRIIPFTNRTRLSLFSSPDLVFCLTHRPTSSPLDHSSLSHASEWAEMKEIKKKGYVHSRSDGTNIFIFKARTTATAKEWCWLLFRVLGGAVPTSLDISVPGLGAMIKIPIPVDLPESRNVKVEKEEVLVGEGYRMIKSRDVVKACLEQLSSVPEFTQLLEQVEARGVECRLAWRRGRVLDWVSDDQYVVAGHSLRQPQLETVLEIRPGIHYPTFVSLSSKNSTPLQDSTQIKATTLLSEPPGIEGYLERKRAKTGSERIYLSSHDNYLFLSPPAKAYPPDPPIPIAVAVENPAAVALAPFFSGRILPPLTKNPSGSWSRVFSKRAAEALDVTVDLQEGVLDKLERLEKRRAEDQILATTGFVNVNDISDVALTAGSVDSFEITFKKSGRVVQFQCHSKAVAAEWIGRLNALRKYWKNRERIETVDKMELKHRGPTQLKRERPGETLEPVCPNLLEASSPLLSNIYNRCVEDGCRPITRSSEFFVKEGLRGMFRNRFCFIVGGHLLEYDVTRKDIYGQSLATVYHQRRFTLSLRDCYVYSGSVAESVLGPDTSGGEFRPSSEKTFSRIYANGIMSSDSLEDSTFVIWKGLAGRSLSKKSAVRVYRARNMVERDEWIFALNSAIGLLYKKPREALREEKLKEWSS